ncbi:MAG TPA: hypothetical protein VIX82_05350 [Solirubrobacteraceae bacterium]
MPSRELDESRFILDASALNLGWGGEILGADKVRGGLLLPGDLAGWLRERRQRLPRETAERLLGRGLVAVLEEELPDHVGIDANGPVLARLQPWRWLRADELGLGLSDVRHHRRHIEQLGDAVIGAGLGDHHPAVGVPAQDGRPLGGADRLAARVDVGVEIAELIASFSAAGPRHRDAKLCLLRDRIVVFIAITSSTMTRLGLPRPASES